MGRHCCTKCKEKTATHTRIHTTTAPLCMCACICMTDTHTCTLPHTHHSFFLSHWQAHIPSALQGGGQRDSCHCGTSLHRRTHTPHTPLRYQTHRHTPTHTNAPPPPHIFTFKQSLVQIHSSQLIDCHNGWRD